MTEPRRETGTTQLAVVFGRVERPVHEVLGVLVRHRPQIVWREPVPTRARLSGFVGLWCGELEQLAANHAAAALDEARLFWDDPAGVLHLVADVYGKPDCRATRWAAFWECPGAENRPAWVDGEVLGEPGTEQTWDVDPVVEEDVLAMAQRDRNRYGLNVVCRPADVEGLRVCKYFRGTELVLWRVSRG